MATVAPISRRRFLLGITAASLSCRRRAEGFPGYAFVANSAGRAVAVVDLGAFAVARHILLDADPVQLVSLPGRPAVITLTPGSSRLHEIDTTTLTLARRLRCAPGSDSILPARGGELLWVLSRRSRRLWGVDTAAMERAAEYELPFRPADWALSPDGHTAAFALGAEPAIAFLDLGSGSWARHPIGEGTADLIRFRPDGRQVLVGNRGARCLTICEAGSGRVVTHLPMAVAPEHFCFKLDGGELFVTGEGMDAVVTVHPYQTQIASTTLAGRRPGVMAASRDFLFVANPESSTVTVLDIVTRRVVAAVPVGSYPCHISVTPDGQYALVLNRDSGDMAVIRAETLAGRRRRMAPLFTMVPVGSQPIDAVVRPVEPAEA